MSETKGYKELQAELDGVLAVLQDDTVDVDEAVKLYERGMFIIAELEQQLKQAENKVIKIKEQFDKR